MGRGKQKEEEEEEEAAHEQRTRICRKPKFRYSWCSQTHSILHTRWRQFGTPVQEQDPGCVRHYLGSALSNAILPDFTVNVLKQQHKEQGIEVNGEESDTTLYEKLQESIYKAPVP